MLASDGAWTETPWQVAGDANPHNRPRRILGFFAGGVVFIMVVSQCCKPKSFLASGVYC